MKTIVVTGSGTGFGLLTVKILAQKGYTVYATMRHVHTKNSSAAQNLLSWAIINNADVRIIELDVTNDESVEKAVSMVIRESGQIDVLINNAGMFTWGLSEMLSTRQLEEIFQVNVFGAVRMNNAVLPYMHRRENGLIIQLSSGLSRLHLPYLGAYSATKAAIDTLAETLSYELSKSGIDSVIIQPGAYPATDLFTKLVPADKPLPMRQYGEFGCCIEQGIQGMFGTSAGNRQPVEVAELIAEIVETPRGKRKLWTGIGIGPGETYVDFINHSLQQYSQRVQGLLGIY